MSQGEPMLRLIKHVGGRREPVEISVNHLVIAGWTGRRAAPSHRRLEGARRQACEQRAVF
jgi:hypothetical protein